MPEIQNTMRVTPHNPGTITDISEQKQIEDELRLHRDHLEALAEEMAGRA